MLIDVSEHNGVINWTKVKAAGVTGAIIRCGYGKNLKKQDDKKFTRNMDGAINAGLDIGVYLYSYATNKASAKSEAEHVLRLVDPYKEYINLPIYYDLEESNTKDVAKENAVVFGDIIENAGYWCGVYASLSWFNTYLKGLDRFTKWVAAWGKDNGKPGTKPTISGCDLWQYTSKGKINGISGNVDLDELLNAKIRTKKPVTDVSDDKTNNNPKKDETASEGKLKPINDIAKEVIAGKWGNGEERKKKLKAAGYDYDAVQKAVNAMLNKITYMTVNTEKTGLRQRTKPALTGSIIQVIPKGAKVELIEKTNKDWYKVKYQGKTGYCASKFLKG